mgnify:CR=1 FL=1
MMERLTDLPTLRINPERKIPLKYRGRNYFGHEGDSIATALYANKVRIYSRSLKYHRPRGLYSMDGECSNCLMEVGGEPNVQTETTLLRPGMEIKTQNIVGTPEHDAMSFIDRFDQMMPAGFYYHYFHKPYKLWPFFQNRIRRAAGLGRISPDFRAEGIYDEIYPTVDVCVIGAGPAGIHAAMAAAEQGQRVIIIEARPWAGGFFEYRPAAYDIDTPLYQRARKLARKLETAGNIRFFPHTFMMGLYHDNRVTAFQVGDESDYFRERYLEITCKSIVAATGCIERPLLFDHNERPGIMQIGCAHRLALTYGLLPGKKAVFCIGDDLGLEAAIDLADLGLEVRCVADARLDGQKPLLLAELEKRDIPFLRGWLASSSGGKTVVKKAVLSTLDGMNTKEFNCDILIASAGLTPVAGPLFLSRAKMTYDPDTGFFLPAQLPPGLHAAGRMLGYRDNHAIEKSGTLAGLKAAADNGFEVGNRIKRIEEEMQELPGPAVGSKFVQAPGKGRKRFICFDEDVTLKNINQACEMGFDKAELIKRFTTAGLGPGQGGIPGHNLPLLLEQYAEDSGAPVLPTTVRPPLVPGLLRTFAGSSHDMFKRTPLHETMDTLPGTIFRRAGTWKRVRYFSADFSSRQEIDNIHSNVGLIDVSTLGAFRIFGPDALAALQRVYVGDMSKIKEGRARYSAMCNEDGCLMDDGIIVKRGENDYFFTSSSNRAESTTEWIRFHTRHEDWDFSLVNLTDAYGAINLAGPNSRKVLSRITDADLSNEAFPYNGYREFDLQGGIPARVFRLGFVGELSFELHIAASYLRTVWNLLMQAGKPEGIQPFGLEAQNTLRLQKGHVIIGQESEIRTTLHDLGLGFLWYRDKPEAKTVGAPALRFTEHQKGRMKLVGLEMEDVNRPAKDGSLVVDENIRGHICTSRYSGILGKSIAMALVTDELAEIGTRVAIFEDNMGDARLYARVVKTPFYDPEGKRLRM